MSTSHYQLTIEIERGVKDVFSFFSDLQNHVHLHPLLTKVSIVNRFDNEQGQEVVVFEVQERIKVLGFISVPNTYIAEQIVIKEKNTCIFEAKSFPNVHLRLSYTFLDCGNNRTKVEENATIKTPWGLSVFVTKTAKNAHQALLKQLKKYLEENTGIKT